MTEKEMELQVLLKELDHADNQISSYLDLQIKTLGLVFTVLAASLGLLLASNQADAISPHNLAKLLVIIASTASFGVLQSSVNYGIALGYMYGKSTSIAPRIQKLLALAERPLRALESFRESPSRIPVFLATAVLAVGIVVLEVGLLSYAWRLSAPESLTRWAVRAAFVLLVAVVVCQILIADAMRKIGLVEPTGGHRGSKEGGNGDG